jgi:membrane protease YdiL (CAAX protease family)
MVSAVDHPLSRRSNFDALEIAPDRNSPWRAELDCFRRRYVAVGFSFGGTRNPRRLSIPRTPSGAENTWPGSVIIDRKLSSTAMAKPRRLLKFFLLTYVVTWTSWLAAWAMSGGSAAARYPGVGLPTLLFYIGVFAPLIVAVWLTRREEGDAGVRALLQRLVQWDVGLQWYALALLYTIAIKLAVALIHRLITGEWPTFGTEPLYIMLAATIGSTLILGQAGEEVGWRGYALPRLAARFGLGGASVALGLIWALWHLPLFFIAGTNTTGQSFPLYLLQVTAISVAITWLYANTKGSLLLTMLMHSAVNNTKDIVPSAEQNATNPYALSGSLVGWLTAALLWVCAGYFLFRMRRLPNTIGLESE